MSEETAFYAFIIDSQPSALATDVAHLLGYEAVSVREKTFNDGEKRLQLPISVSGKEVIIFQTITDQPDAVIFETLRIIDAAKTAGAEAITVVFPCYPYARQDRIVQDGCGIPPKLVAKLLKTAGADRLVTVDMHAPRQIDDFPLPTFNVSTEALFANPIAVPCRACNRLRRYSISSSAGRTNDVCRTAP